MKIPQRKGSIMGPIVGDPPAIQWIPLDRLLVDDSYQRGMDQQQSQKVIASIAQGWDWRLCQPLMVSARGGAMYVIDGQHRLEAARRRPDVPHLPCSVSAYADASEEAAIFVRANLGRKALTPLDIFRASVAAGDETASEAHRLVTEAGLKVARHTNTSSLEPGTLTNIRGIITALKRHRASIVSAALNVIGGAFAAQPIPRPATLFSALVALFEDTNNPVDPDALAEAIGSMTAEDWTCHPDLQDCSASVRVCVLVGLIRDEIAEVGMGRLD
jgi:hypothetical protein